MASNFPSDPPPSISAAELRRRLLASTPPPMSAGPSTAEVDDAPPANHQDAMLARLRMPTQGEPARRPVPTPVAIPDPATLFATDPSQPLPPSRPPSKDPATEQQRLKDENKQLRQLLTEMKSLLQEASDAEQHHANEKSEFARVLGEKQQQIDSLTAQLAQIAEQINNGTLGPPAQPKTRTELEEWSDELEQEAAKLNQSRRGIDEERRQLREDEESLEKQMRQMEVSMARERAIMARQEQELKRLSAEIQHELELMQRGDANLREQMLKFQRRAQEVLTTPKPGQPPMGGGGSGPQGWPGGRR